LIVVFGASGFIGTYLIDRLVADGYDVVATDISQIGEDYYKKLGVPFVPLDITQEDEFGVFPKENIVAVVNCACLQPANISDKECNPSKYIDVNVVGTLNILEYCRKAKSRLISFNSRKPIKGEYGMYAISERAATDCVSLYKQQYGMRNITFRIPPVYGYGCYTEIFKEGKPVKTGFQIFIDNAIKGEPLEVWGNAKLGRPIIYVKDVVSAVISVFGSRTSGMWDIWSVKKLTLKQEAEDIIEVFSPKDNKSKIMYCPDKPNSIEKTRDLDFNWSVFRRWKPQYSFRDMLVDYKKEWESGKFDMLVERRKEMFDGYFRN